MALCLMFGKAGGEGGGVSLECSSVGISRCAETGSVSVIPNITKSFYIC